MSDRPKLVVLTGGPGAGKTAVLEVARRMLCPHVVVLPEAAGILWTGGFPRRATTSGLRCAQRAIVRVQLELQQLAIEDAHASVVLCDRGTLDGLAYWPDEPDAYFASFGSSRAEELARYASVIQLRPPSAAHGYRAEGARIETAEQAAAIDQRITQAWAGHPRHAVLNSEASFDVKLRAALDLIRAELPGCCSANATRSQTPPLHRGLLFADPRADPSGGEPWPRS